MDHLRKQQRDFLKKINCNDIGKKVDEIVTYINREEKVNNMTEEEIKRMFEYINGLSPLNLWTPNTWDKPLEEKEFNDKVKPWVKKIKK
jgi:hypothetical protein